MRSLGLLALAAAAGAHCAAAANVQTWSGWRKMRGTPEAPKEQVEAARAAYPRLFPLKRLLTRWNPDITDLPPDGGRMFDTLEHLDYQDSTQRARAVHLREVQVPFIVHNIPNINDVVAKWKDTAALAKRFGKHPYQATTSHANHLMFFRGHGGSSARDVQRWNAILAERNGKLGHEEDDNLEPGDRVASGAKGEAAARRGGYTYRHPPPTHVPTTFPAWVEGNAERRARIQAAQEEVVAIAKAAAAAGQPVPGTIAEVAAQLRNKQLRPYVGAALSALHREQGVTAGQPASGTRGQWPWWWYPLNMTDVNAAQWYPRAYLEFGDDHDNGAMPPGQDITIFRSGSENTAGDLFLQDKQDIRGLHCRFGSAGTIAEAHWDGHLNFIAILGGAKRYILMPGTECRHLAIMHNGPSSRHVGYDGSDLRTLYTKGRESYEDYSSARALEVVVHEGEVLYVPSYYMHWIISLTDNYQCNCRSGVGATPLNEMEAVAACLTPPKERGADWKTSVAPQRWWESPQSWRAAEEAAALQEIDTLYAPAIMALLEGEPVPTQPAPTDSDTYLAAAKETAARVAAHPELQAPMTLPQAATLPHAERMASASTAWRAPALDGASWPLSGAAAVAVLAVAALLMLRLRRSGTAPQGAAAPAA